MVGVVWNANRTMATVRILISLLLLLALHASVAFLVAPAMSRRDVLRLASGPQSTIDTEAAKPEVPDVKIEGVKTTGDATKSSQECAAGPCPGFAKCDGSYRDKGCIDGKIQGGLAVVPGLGWWPIKAYRPCPAASEAGYGYKRKGPDFGEFLAGERRSVTEEKEEAAKAKKQQRKEAKKKRVTSDA